MLFLALTAMSYLRLTCTESGMTRQLKGAKVDIMEPMKPLGKISLVVCPHGSQ